MLNNNLKSILALIYVSINMFKSSRTLPINLFCEEFKQTLDYINKNI